ncbi:branched-chain amino acid transport system permease protein [Agromyces terreus]|uniref:Branched-chain amino acid transport system permease protein n=1 Tax=Agromyces terreus TaxID=424795 RepID=A0A9X2H1M1_9MICO|nr:branched-chain amino acid ABC transporter permease [Agromyces terreus]MCP2370938.1 branched-chain amino acid transport system permease protein [Agromyces terreus]
MSADTNARPAASATPPAGIEAATPSPRTSGPLTTSIRAPRERRRRSTPRLLVTALVLTLVAIGATFLLDPYRNYQFALIAATFCATAGLTLLIGLTGQLSLGHAALMAAGGYGYALTANALTDAGVDGVPRFVVSLAAAAAASALLGLLLGLAAARLKGPYLSGVTLVLVIALPAFTSVFSGVFRGDQGVQIAYDGVPEVLRRIIAVEQWQAWVAILVAAVFVTWLAALRNGRAGLRMRAVRDDETAARLQGVRAGRVKVLAFTASSVTAGAGGAVLCFVTQSVSPGAYTLAFSLLLLVAVVIGGLGSLLGAFLGSIVIVMLPWLIQTATGALDLSADAAQRLTGNLPVLVFGVLLIVVTAAWPGGIRATLPKRLFSKRMPRAAAAPAAGPDAAVAADSDLEPRTDSAAEPIPTTTER